MIGQRYTEKKIVVLDYSITITANESPDKSDESIANLCP